MHITKFDPKNLKEDEILLDVRTPEEYSEFHLENAQNMNFYDDFISKIKVLDKQKTYYVYCRSGGRSSEASQIMLDYGFNKVVNLEGGVLALNK